MLKIEDLQKSFDRFKALNGVNLTVDKGELVAVIGPNGAGKTTLFNLITGQIRADKGQILFKNEDITRLQPHQVCRRGIARSFQIANIFPRLSVFRNVQVSVLAQQKLSEKMLRPAASFQVEATNRILESVGLIAKKDDIAGSLSHGDKRTLEVAIALGNEPELLILDEPTAGMSPEETATTMELINNLAQERGITILFCEHDMEVVFNVASSIMVMQHGRTIIQGPLDEVRKNKEVQEAYLGGTDVGS